MELSLFAISSLVAFFGFALAIFMTGKKEAIKKPVKVDKRIF